MITTTKRLAKTLEGCKTNDAIERTLGNIDWERVDLMDDQTAMMMGRGLIQSPSALGMGVRHNLVQIVELAQRRDGPRKDRALAATAQLLWQQLSEIFELIPEMAHCDDDDLALYVHQGLRGLCMCLEHDDMQLAADYLWDEVAELDPEGEAQWGET